MSHTRRSSGLNKSFDGVINVMPHTSGKRIPLAYSLLSAGAAIEITDDGYALLDVNALLTGGREGCIAFVVTGDSMREDILPGYIVFIDTLSEPRNGDTVAINVNGQNCIKVFEHKQGLRLVPKNGDYPTYEVQPSDATHVLGVVRGHVAVY